jgi:hypothetical protein
MHLLLSALSWDPQIRGAVIVITAVLILCGSVYMLLATNTGSRLGFLIAVAGLSGWMFLMGVTWMVFGIGMKGREPHWEPKELIVGPLQNRATVDGMDTFPNGWNELEESNKIRADAQAAADGLLAPAAGGGHGAEDEGPTPEEQARFKSPYTRVDQYKAVAGYNKGGDNELFTIGKHKFYFRHSPHYAVIQVQALQQECSDENPTKAPNCYPPPAVEGTPVDATFDTSKPVTTLIMVRDLGSVRFPPFLISLFSLIVFGVSCSALHERDKEIMRARGQIPAPA